MDISCEKCGKAFVVPDDRIPEGKTVSVRCPQCKMKVSVNSSGGQPEPQKQTAKAGPAFGFDEASNGGKYDVADKPFDFIEEEGVTALVCESDPAIREAIKQVLDFMEYHISEAEDTRDALKKMRYHNYDLVVVNESFSSRSPDANGVIIYLERLKMKTRRDTYTILITRRFKTMDVMAAFQKSVHIVVNQNDIKHFEKIIKRGQTDNAQLYRIYRETQKSLGTL